jgi:CBS-domain-containing membrane protein
MKSARQLMTAPAPTLRADTPIREIARRLVEEGLEGACVVGDDGKLIGVVTAMDLIFQEKRPHLPAVFTFMDAVLVFGRRRTEAELTRMGGTTAAAIMTDRPRTATPDTPLDQLATLMVDKHYTLIPVLEAGALVGVITRASVLRAVFLEPGGG